MVNTVAAVAATAMAMAAAATDQSNNIKMKICASSARIEHD